MKPNRDHHVVKEYKELEGLKPGDEEGLRAFALANQTDQQGKYRPVLVLKNNRLHAQNYVGIIETRKGTVLEILPKVDFAENDDKTQEIFLKMLRDWRGLKAAQFNETSIKALRRFTMLEVFVHLFLTNLVLLTQRGLARHYLRDRSGHLGDPPDADRARSVRGECVTGPPGGGRGRRI